MALRKLTINIVALLSASAIARVISAVTLMIIARQLGPDAFGQYTASVALVTLVFTSASLGLDGWLLYKGGVRPFSLDSLFAAAATLKFAMGTLAFLALWLLSFKLNPASFPWILLTVGALALWSEGIARSAWTVFKASLRNEYTFFLMLTLQFMFLGITLFLTRQEVQAPESFLAGRFLSAFAIALLSAILATRWVGFKFEREVLLAAFKGTLPFAASVTLATVYGRADLTIVANELGKEAAGIYGPALVLANALFLIPLSFFEVAVPFFSRVYTQNPHKIVKLASFLIPSMLLLGAGLGAALAKFAYPLIKLAYGKAYWPSGNVLKILGAVLALRCPNVILAALLIAVGKQSYRVYAQAFSAGLNVLLNLSLAYRVGVLGVARIYVFTEFVLFTGYLGAFLLWMMKKRPRLGY